MGVYDVCPVLKSDNFTLRLVERGDAPGLLKVYSDEKAVPLFNNDNCNGDDFHYTTLERMVQAIDFWLKSYHEWKCFVRWTILAGEEPIGTVELFHREAADAFNHHGLLRLDLRSDYETVPAVTELLTLLHQHAYELFDCPILATKAPAFAAARCEALVQCGYIRSASVIVGHDGTEYGDYWVRPE